MSENLKDSNDKPARNKLRKKVAAIALAVAATTTAVAAVEITRSLRDDKNGNGAEIKNAIERNKAINLVDEFVNKTAVTVLDQRDNLKLINVQRDGREAAKNRGSQAVFDQFDLNPDGSPANRQIRLFRDVTDVNGKTSRYVVELKGRSIDTDPDQVDQISKLNIYKVDLDEKGSTPPTYYLDLGIASIDNEGYSIAGNPNGIPENPSVFHTTKDIESLDDPASTIPSVPLTVDWATERMQAGQEILDTILA